jgi:hypothetical protein
VLCYFKKVFKNSGFIAATLYLQHKCILVPKTPLLLSSSLCSGGFCGKSRPISCDTSAALTQEDARKILQVKERKSFVEN